MQDEIQNVKLIDLKIKNKRMPEEEKLKWRHFQEEGERLQQEVKSQRKLQARSVVEFWDEQNRERELLKQEKKEGKRKKKKDKYSSAFMRNMQKNIWNTSGTNRSRVENRGHLQTKL